jgi:hypothetical protein
MTFEKIDSYNSFKAIEKQIDASVKAGTLEKERAFAILKEARKNYKNDSYNREMERLGYEARNTKG